MLKEVQGDILLSGAGTIAHGVAPNDPFSQGLALSLREKAPSLYKDFRHYCQTQHPKPGTLWTWVGADGVRVVNLFTQEPAEGHHGGNPGRASVTNVAHALKALRQLAEGEEVRPSLPTSPWMIVLYILAAFVGLQVLFLLVALISSLVGGF